jgi:hypothetical protein
MQDLVSSVRLHLFTRIKTARPSKIAIGKTWLESCATSAPPAIVVDDFTTFIVLYFIPLYETVSSIHFC